MATKKKKKNVFLTVSNALDVFGEDKFIELVDGLTLNNDNTPPPVIDTVVVLSLRSRVKKIKSIIAKKFGISSEDMMVGNGENGRNAINVFTHILKRDLKLTHAQVCVHIKRGNIASVTYALDIISKLDKKLENERKVLELIDKIRTDIRPFIEH